MLKSLSLAAGASAALMALAIAFPVAVAEPAHERASACFNLNDIQGERVPDNRNVFFRATGGRVYHLEFGSECPNATTFTLIFHSVDNDPQNICSANALDVKVRDTGAGCIPTRLSVLTPKEAESLPPNARP